MEYTQLGKGQRYQIKALLGIGRNRTEVATQLGVDKSTISREVRCNYGQQGYRPKQAHEKAVERHMSKVNGHIPLENWQLIESKLKVDLSPEQISGWLKKEQLPSICRNGSISMCMPISERVKSFI
jgi:transposase, IS30 family